MHPRFEKQPNPVSWLTAQIPECNIAGQFSDTALQELGADIVAGVQFDEASRSEWRETIDKGLDIAEQVRKAKDFPWENAANSKDPLIAVAAMQFAARAGAEIIRGRDVVKCQITGNDPSGQKEKRAKRVGDFMSWQCLEQIDGWQDETDQLLMSISPIGMYYKKTDYDQVSNRTVSVARTPEKVIVNDTVRTLEQAERITDLIDDLSRNDVISRIRSQQWLDIEQHLADDDATATNDIFYECHCWYDLDGDGYKEPWIVTVHKESMAVVRICARFDAKGIITDGAGQVVRIEPLQRFTLFPFLPNFRATFHKLGFCQLLVPTVESINSLQNQLLDAGTLANVGGGFVGKGAKLPAGKIRFKLNEWVPVETTGQSLRDNLFPNPAKEPSAVLFNLLARLDDKAQRLASVNETMMGDIPGGNVPASTVLASLDQALKVYTGILRRLFRSFQSEFSKIYRFNNLFLTDQEYIRVLDLTPQDVAAILGVSPEMVTNLITETSNLLVKKDFNLDDCDVQPVMDPTAASETLRLARANAVLHTMPGNPEVLKYYYRAVGVPDRDIELFIPKAQNQPNPALIKLQADIMAQKEKGELDRHKLLLDAKKLELEEALTPFKQLLLESQALNTKATAGKNLAAASGLMEQLQQQIALMENDYNDKLAGLIAMIERGEMDAAGDVGGVAAGAEGSGPEPGRASDVVQPGGDQASDRMALAEAGLPDGSDGVGGVFVPGQPEPDTDGNGPLLGEPGGAQPNTTVADVAAAEQQPGNMI